MLILKKFLPMQHKIFLSLILGLSTTIALATNSADSPPTVYQPTYVYGETPAGVYMGDPDEIGGEGMDDADDMGEFMPNGEPMHEFQTQSGEQEQSFQYLQGQEQLMEENSKEALKKYNDEQVIGDKMQQQYTNQINQQTDQTNNQQAPIILPNM